MGLQSEQFLILGDSSPLFQGGGSWVYGPYLDRVTAERVVEEARELGWRARIVPVSGLFPLEESLGEE